MAAHIRPSDFGRSFRRAGGGLVSYSERTDRRLSVPGSAGLGWVASPPVVVAGGAVVKESQMAMGDKIKHAGEQAAGKVKEGAGKVTGDKGLETEGKTDQAVADVKQAGDKAKDALGT